jgi:hypothetical protein
VGELCALLHKSHQQFSRAGKIAGGLAVITDSLTRLAKLEFGLASRRIELLYNLTSILLQTFATARSGLTAGLNKVAVAAGPFVEVFHQSEQRGFVQGGDVLAQRTPAAGFLVRFAFSLDMGLKEVRVGPVKTARDPG